MLPYHSPLPQKRRDRRWNLKVFVLSSQACRKIEQTPKLTRQRNESAGEDLCVFGVERTKWFFLLIVKRSLRVPYGAACSWSLFPREMGEPLVTCALKGEAIPDLEPLRLCKVWSLAPKITHLRSSQTRCLCGVVLFWDLQISQKRPIPLKVFRVRVLIKGSRISTLAWRAISWAWTTSESISLQSWPSPKCHCWHSGSRTSRFDRSNWCSSGFPSAKQPRSFCSCSRFICVQLFIVLKEVAVLKLLVLFPSRPSWVCLCGTVCVYLSERAWRRGGAHVCARWGVLGRFELSWIEVFLFFRRIWQRVHVFHVPVCA